MQPFDEIKKYSKTVCEQIRWKKAHSTISEEIENHLCDQRDAYISQGDDKKIATQKAILQMGDAVSVGTGLDKTHKPKPQWIMILLTVMLMMIGMLSNYFIGYAEYSLNNFSPLPYILALAVFLICYFLDFSILGKHAKHFYFVVLIFSVIGFLFSEQVNGKVFFFANRFSVSLSYFSLIFPLAYSLLIYALRHRGYKGIILSVIAYVPFAVILLLIPSLDSFALFTILAFAILCTSIVKGWFGINKRKGLLLLLTPTLLAVIAAIYYVIHNPYLLRRFSTAINPYFDRDGYGYIHCLVRDLLANSQIWGKGTVPSQFSNYVSAIPESNTDYILTALTHNFGWITFIGISVVIIAFSIFGLYCVSKQKSVLGTIVSLSIMFTFVMQAVIYITNNLGYGVLSALSLPLVSYGKVALMINSALIGFMLSVFRTGDIVNDSIKSPTKNSSMFSHEDGKLIINFRG